MVSVAIIASNDRSSQIFHYVLQRENSTGIVYWDRKSRASGLWSVLKSSSVSTTSNKPEQIQQKLKAHSGVGFSF